MTATRVIPRAIIRCAAAAAARAAAAAHAAHPPTHTQRVLLSSASAAVAAKSSSPSPLSKLFDAKVTATPFNDAVVLEASTLATSQQPSGLTPSRDDKPMGYKLSYVELARAVDAFANGVREIGVGKGDVLLSVWDGEGETAGTTSLEYTYVQLGCAKAGATLAVMDSTKGVTADAVVMALQKTKAKVLIVPSKMPFALEELIGAARTQWGTAIELEKAPALQMVIQNGEMAQHEGVYRLRDVLLYRPATATAVPQTSVGLMTIAAEGSAKSFKFDDLVEKGFPFPTLIPAIIA